MGRGWTSALATPPTTLQWRNDLRVEDYRKKATKEAEPFLTLPLFAYAMTLALPT